MYYLLDYMSLIVYVSVIIDMALLCLTGVIRLWEREK